MPAQPVRGCGEELSSRRLPPPSPPPLRQQVNLAAVQSRRREASGQPASAQDGDSRDQASRAAGVPIAAVIHHGIDLDVYRPGPGDGGFLLFMGRMSPDKGAGRAVRIAHASGRPLLLATKIREAAEWDYLKREVRPLLGPDDNLMTEPSLASRLEMLQGATALINPIMWPEPFGLVMAEALATGTPVLAFPYGAAPEIINDGKTGFLCRDEADMVAAIDRVGQIDRAECRAAAEQQFSLQRMARDHVQLYRRVLENPSVLGARHAANNRGHCPLSRDVNDDATLTAEVRVDPAVDVLRRATGTGRHRRAGDPGRGLDVLHQRYCR